MKEYKIQGAVYWHFGDLTKMVIFSETSEDSNVRLLKNIIMFCSFARVSSRVSRTNCSKLPQLFYKVYISSKFNILKIYFCE